MKRAYYCFIPILAVFALASCKERASDRSAVKADLLPDDWILKTLLPRLFENEIVVCITRQISDERKLQFETAAMTWIAPLRELTTRPLVQRIIIKDETDTSCGVDTNFDLKIDPGYDRRAHYKPAERIIRIGASDDYGVVRHEFGHAFGLADTYSDDIAAGCREGQPRSVMCQTLNPWYFRNRSLSTLLPDDFLGVRAAFCKVHGSAVPLCSAVPTVGPRLNIDSFGVPKFRLDATFVANDPRCAARGGVAVSEVLTGTSTERSGLRPGMCIRKIGLKPITTPADVAAALGGSFGSMLDIEAYAQGDGSDEVPRFVNARLEGEPPVPVVENVMLVYKGTTLRFDDGTTQILPTNVPCQIRALGDRELRVACHNKPGWAPREKMDLVIEMTGE